MSGYSQLDPNWEWLTLGPGPNNIHDDGCYLCAFAMEATWMGKSVNPPQLNQLFLSKGIFGAGCGECLPDNALQRAFPDVCRLANIWDFSASPADLSKLDNSSPTVFKCVELGWWSNGVWFTHFAPVADGTKGAASTMVDPYTYPVRVRPISDYGDPATVIQKITENDWILPAPQPPAPAPAPANPEGYWPGWDIARGVAMLNATDGVKLDGLGGLHPIGNAPAIQLSAYWPGWDIARDVALNPDKQGGYVLDGWGGLHPFALGGAALPPEPKVSAYWAGWDIARRVIITAQGTGFVMDAWGGRHGFSTP